MGDPRVSIQEAAAPLAFATTGVDLAARVSADGVLTFRTATRSLEGMQKEALIAQHGSPQVWRVVSDEGPYLNGTDLAPAPLAFFSAGMAATCANAILHAAGAQNASISDLRISQDNRYSMEGSAIRGTMTGAALPVKLAVTGTFGGDSVSFERLVQDAVAGSPLEALMREQLVDTFSIVHNGRSVPTGAVVESESPVPNNPASLFRQLVCNQDAKAVDHVISKLEAAEAVSDTVHGAGASMRETQKRELTIRSELSVRADGLRSIQTRIVRPIGSVSRFLAEDATTGGPGRAPIGLVYASAGLAFCFMTQLGRYAGIVGKNLESYCVVQDTAFDTVTPKAFPVDTHTFLETSEDDSVAREYIDMGEQTCFLHAACRMSNETLIRVNGTLRP